MSTGGMKTLAAIAALASIDAALLYIFAMLSLGEPLTVKRFLCTLKFQGDTDFAVMQRFAAVPGSRLVHLHHNKHELTWIRL